jgi:hypothetical protein
MGSVEARTHGEEGQGSEEQLSLSVGRLRYARRGDPARAEASAVAPAGRTLLAFPRAPAGDCRVVGLQFPLARDKPDLTYAARSTQHATHSRSSQHEPRSRYA